MSIFPDALVSLSLQLQHDSQQAVGAVHLFSLPLTSEVSTPNAAIHAQTINATRKACANVDCSAAICPGCIVEWNCCAISRLPASAPPRLVKIAPARATLMLCPTTRPVARKPEAMPCCPRGAAPISALLLGD